MRYALALPFMLAATVSAAFDCTFTTECFESEACGESAFQLAVLKEDQLISTEFGDITIVAIREQPKLITVFGSGQGAEYLLSITPEAARLSTHMNDGPMAVQYLGTCEGAF